MTAADAAHTDDLMGSEKAARAYLLRRNSRSNPAVGELCSR